MHVAYNLIHPEKLTINVPYQDFPKLSRACREIENEYGLMVDNGIEASNPAEPKITQRAAAMEAHSGEQSFQAFALEQREKILIELQTAMGWQDVHRILAGHGIAIKPRANGFVLVNPTGKGAIKASALDRCMAKGHLEKRFGAFIAPESGQQEKPNQSRTAEGRAYQKKPRQPRSPERDQLYKDYQTALAEKIARIDAEKARTTSAHVWLKILWQESKTELYATPYMSRRTRAVRMRMMLQLHRQEVLREKADHKSAMVEIKKDYPWYNWNGYLQHQAMQGNIVALDVLRSQEQRKADQAAIRHPAKENIWLDVPFADKDAAKAAGAKWDGREKRWYAPEGADLNKLQPWLHKQEMRLAEPVLQPGAEFGRVLHESGLIIEGEPVMDGNIHRVPVEGGKRGAKDGAYCGYADGRPNGWYQNYKTGVKGKWLATGHVLTEAARTALRQQSAEYLAAAEAERQATQEKAMKRAYAKWVNAEPVQGQDHPYLTRKGIDACSLRQDKHGNLVVPGYDLETGRLQTVEYINKEGGKWYEKGCPKKGAMCILPDQAALKDSEVVLMTEGYATGASVHLATGLPVAVAFDANNLKDAAMTIKRACPNVRITICADNDARLPDARNVGLAKAKEAATAVPGCKFVTANFSPDEQKKGLTDFNDLHQARGLDAVKKSIMAKVNEREPGVER